jgi:hypothetical protein
VKPAPLIYFFPKPDARGLRNLFSAAATEIPDQYAAKFARRTMVPQATGPEDHRGLLVTAFEDVLVSYDPATQDWRQVGPDVWAGVAKQYEPAQFAKPLPNGRLPASGYTVRLGDGRDWVIPVALADAPNFDMPWRETLGPDGGIVREPDPEYAAVCRAAEIMWENVSDDAVFSMGEDDLRTACATALSVNYRLDLQDCLALGLFTSESYRAIVGAVLDLPALDELVKKSLRRVRHDLWRAGRLHEYRPTWADLILCLREIPAEG